MVFCSPVAMESKRQLGAATPSSTAASRPWGPSHPCSLPSCLPCRGHWMLTVLVPAWLCHVWTHFWVWKWRLGKPFREVSHQRDICISSGILGTRVLSRGGPGSCRSRTHTNVLGNSMPLIRSWIFQLSGPKLSPKKWKLFSIQRISWVDLGKQTKLDNTTCHYYKL